MNRQDNERVRKGVATYNQILELLKDKDNDVIIDVAEILAAKIIAIGARDNGLDDMLQRFTDDVRDLAVRLMAEEGEDDE